MVAREYNIPHDYFSVLMVLCPLENGLSSVVAGAISDKSGCRYYIDTEVYETTGKEYSGELIRFKRPDGFYSMGVSTQATVMKVSSKEGLSEVMLRI